MFRGRQSRLIISLLTDAWDYLGFHQSSYTEDSAACFSRGRCFGRYVPFVDTKRRVRCHHHLQRLRQDVVHRERSHTTRLDSFLRRQARLEDCRIQRQQTLGKQLFKQPDWYTRDECRLDNNAPGYPWLTPRKKHRHIGLVTMSCCSTSDNENSACMVQFSLTITKRMTPVVAEVDDILHEDVPDE
jgi:hypothetical protein